MIFYKTTEEESLKTSPKNFQLSNISHERIVWDYSEFSHEKTVEKNIP